MKKTIQIQCGLMHYDEQTKMVYSDPRQGTQEDEKQFCWKSKDKEEPEIELYLFQNDAKFEKVKHTNGGRIYYLHFESFEDKYFFWFQDPDYTKDEQIVKELQAMIDIDLEEIQNQENIQTPQNTQTMQQGLQYQQQNSQWNQQQQMFQQINQGFNLGALQGLTTERKGFLNSSFFIENFKTIYKKWSFLRKQRRTQTVIQKDIYLKVKNKLKILMKICNQQN